MASIALDVEPEPLESRNFKPMMRVVQFTPTTPMPLLPTAPTVPDVCVPWPLSSAGTHENAIALNPCDPAGQVIERAGEPVNVTVNEDGAVQIFAARSVCVKSTPLSTMPTTL